MLAFLGNVQTFEALTYLLVLSIPMILGIWLIIEIIRYLRRH